MGARAAFYRAAMLVSGGFAITLAAGWGWDRVNLAVALLYVPFVLVVVFAPEPEVPAQAPRTLKEAVWGPFVGFLGKHRAFEILAFVVLYKLSDQLTQALTRPFLVQVGFGDFDVGVATMTIGQVSAVVGTFLGGLLTQSLGLGRALWIFGGLQLLSNLGYAVVAEVGVNQPVMYAAQGVEHICSGLGTGAFGVLLLRLTEKRFSATQYALLSSLFTLPRVLAGPVAGVAADAFGWRDFFILTVFTGIPGLLMLARFVPWNARELRFEVATPRPGVPDPGLPHPLCARGGARHRRLQPGVAGGSQRPGAIPGQPGLRVRGRGPQAAGASHLGGRVDRPRPRGRCRDGRPCHRRLRVGPPVAPDRGIARGNRPYHRKKRTRRGTGEG